ncbi:MAG: dihydrolipoyl dehydrogenase [Nitrospinae bacterium]|nr:dihydrolipoyl dehydrogenase [Nitrospinota bacterium]
MRVENLVVIGSGPGGYTAAFLAADLGMKTTLVDVNAQPGGVCVRQGCIPSKAFLHLAKLISETREARAWGLDFGEPRIDLAAIRNWKNQMVGQLTNGLSTLCKQRKINLVSGQAAFKDSHTLSIRGAAGELRFDHAILATGSSPAIPREFAECLSPRIMDSTSALEIEEIPRRLLIVGGGYIGLEMGSVYAALGSRVTVVELLDGLLPGVDRDLVRPLQARLNKTFAGIFLKTKAVSVEDTGQGVKVVFDGDIDPREQVFDRVLVAVGRKPNTRGIGLENTEAVVDERGFARVDRQMKTADPAISAIGDVVGGAMLAHKASHEGRAAVEALNGRTPDHGPVIPAVVFTDPEIAWCGLTETTAKTNGTEIGVAKFPWGASGRAVTLGRPDGATKLIVDPQTERVLGVGIVGAGAGELIAEGVLAVAMGAKVGDLANAVHPHPTLSETLMETAQLYFGTAPSFYRKNR